ncbi:hypothetical protein [Streptomyces sp. HNM0574]|uniref:hypothetical protein n=1 Tax=Streptomyces sp. HNM0574 TaxID=2714954 RepID=UPI00146B1162|nr:hypothetical protein [Streptomyces sp. HNM0574]NLU66679.1 hypothetical protein [Streptomyces sp. HNM0574]
MSSGYSFDPEAAKQVEKGLRDAQAELEATGYFSVTAQQGHGFQFMLMSGMDMGSGELADVFGQFCGRWGMAIHGKMQQLNDIAYKLDLSAGLYHEQEQYVNDSLKEVVTSAFSHNPAEGMANAETAGERSWGEVWDESLKPKPEIDTSQPDWGAMGDQWKQTGEDFSTSPWQDVAGPDRWDDSDWQWDGAPEEQQGKGDGGS